MFRFLLLAFVIVYLAPIAVSAALYGIRNRGDVDWRSADRSSVGLLSPAAAMPGAVVRVFSAHTVSWPGHHREP